MTSYTEASARAGGAGHDAVTRFLIASVGYLAFGVVFSLIFHEAVRDSGFSSRMAGAILDDIQNSAWAFAVLTLGALAASLFGGDGRRLLRDGVMALLGTCLFLTGFGLIKTAMPFAVPFFADPMIAEFDRLVHLGHEPWRIAHVFHRWIDPDLATFYYFNLWAFTSLSFPVVLVLLDRDEARRTRYLLMFGFVWVVLGNVTAICFMSAGPVYYSRITGQPGFEGLAEALAASGVTGSLTGKLHEYLWQSYVTLSNSMGSGISAFPSVHVGMATLVSLYAGERSRLLRLPAALHLATILFLSVYLGWHYAVDGYFSILAVLVTAAVLRRGHLREVCRADA